jgi:glyoxylase I family protein
MSGKPRPHHLNLGSTDVARTVAYRDLLGLEPVEWSRNHAPAGRGWLPVPLHPAGGGLARRHELPVNPLACGHPAFRVDDIAAVRAQLDAAGVHYANMGEWAIKGWYQLFCGDPVGRVLEFHQDWSGSEAGRFGGGEHPAPTAGPGVTAGSLLRAGAMTLTAHPGSCMREPFWSRRRLTYEGAGLVQGRVGTGGSSTRCRHYSNQYHIHLNVSST